MSFKKTKTHSMKKIYSSVYTSIRSTPFFGRTILVLSFFCLLIKQVFIFLTYSEVFKEATFWATLTHYLGYFVSDFLVCLILLVLMTINILAKKTFIKIINNIIMSGIFFLFALDIFTMYFFQSRISIFDMSQFINPSLGSFSWMMISIIIVLCMLVIVTFFIVQGRRFKKSKKILLSVYFLLFIIASFGVLLFAPSWFTSLPKNIISINFSAIRENIQWIALTTMPNTYEKFFKETKWQQKNPNIIVVFAESLSPIDSLRIGGVNNNLPYFDLIQKQWITFTNFIANGWTSDTAHIWVLLGIEPLKLMWRQTSSYDWYKANADALPIFFKNQWYTPIFISAAGLEFLNQREFLSWVWFTHIIGEESFADKKKYTFDSAPDHNLYNKTLATIKQQTWSYLAVLQTISLHKPYDTPYGHTQKDSLRYADKSMYYFYLQLKKSWFFKNGILVIVSDHRKMEPLEPKEKEALWDFRYVRWLATIVGTGITPGTVNTNIIQHTDFFYGLKKIVGKWSVHVSKFFNDIFSLTKKRNRAISISRYYNNAYTIVYWSTWSQGKTFDNISEISSTDPIIYKYLSSYMSFEYWSGWAFSGNKAMTIIAHRWSPTHTTENSLSWFMLAKKHGASGIEFDVSQTKDKKNIVIHWETAYSTTCGDSVKIRTHTFDWLETHCTLTNGEPLLTLEEMLKGVDGLFDYYFIEIKVYDSKDAEQQTIDAIQTVQKLGMQDRVIFTSYDKTATYILWSYKNITAWRDTFNIQELTKLPNMNHQYYLMPETLIKKTTPKEVEDMGKKLVVYTVNTIEDAQKLYNEWVRMIMTDNVPLLKWRADKNLK